MKLRNDFVYSALGAIVGVYFMASLVNGKMYSDCSSSLNRINTLMESSPPSMAKKSALENIRELETAVEVTRNNPLYYPFGFARDLIDKI